MSSFIEGDFNFDLPMVVEPNDEQATTSKMLEKVDKMPLAELEQMLRNGELGIAHEQALALVARQAPEVTTRRIVKDALELNERRNNSVGALVESGRGDEKNQQTLDFLYRQRVNPNRILQSEADAFKAFMNVDSQKAKSLRADMTADLLMEIRSKMKRDSEGWQEMTELLELYNEWEDEGKNEDKAGLNRIRAEHRNESEGFALKTREFWLGRSEFDDRDHEEKYPDYGGQTEDYLTAEEREDLGFEDEKEVVYYGPWTEDDLDVIDSNTRDYLGGRQTYREQMLAEEMEDLLPKSHYDDGLGEKLKSRYLADNVLRNDRLSDESMLVLATRLAEEIVMKDDMRKAVDMRTVRGMLIQAMRIAGMRRFGEGSVSKSEDITLALKEYAGKLNLSLDSEASESDDDIESVALDYNDRVFRLDRHIFRIEQSLYQQEEQSQPDQTMLNE